MFLLERIDGDNINTYIALIPEVLQEWALEEPGWRFYGIAVMSKAAGVIVISTKGDICMIRYMYLMPEFRGYGNIDKAMCEIMFSLYEEGFSSIRMDYIPSEYPVIAEISRRFSFVENETDRAYFRFKVSDIRQCKATSYAPQGVMRLKILPEGAKKDLYKLITTHGYDIGELLGHNAGGSFLEYSVVYMEGPKPVGVLMVQDMKNNRLPEGAAAFGKMYPEPCSANIALIYIGTQQLKAPLYLLSALCRNVLKNFEDKEVLTGYFPSGHMTKLLEGTLGVKGTREVQAVLSLNTLDTFYLDENTEDELF